MKKFILTIIIYFLISKICYLQTNWKKLNSPVNDDLHDVFFFNDSIGWAYSYGTGIVIKTIDGGTNWQITSKLDSVYFEQIQFLDQNNGWICGDFGKTLTTVDGGNTWINKSIKESNTRLLLYSMHFFSINEGLVGGLKMVPDNKNEYILYFTNDAGNSWQNITYNPPAFLTNIIFITDNFGFANGSNSIYKTIDRGKTWNLIFEWDPVKNGIRGLFFLNKNIGFAVSANGKVLKTNDGGNKWEEQIITTNRLRSIVFINKNEGYIVGDSNKQDGVLYKTIDGGSFWEIVNTNYPDLHRIKRSRNFLWIVGKKGTILKKNIQ